MLPANGRRVPFNVLATTTPQIIVGQGSRQCVVFVNGTSVGIYLGHSGSMANTGILIATNGVFHDLFSSDEWWVQTASSSGTVSGYVVV